MGLRSPLWLWLATLLVPLIVLYILKVRRENQVVPSTFLWREALRELDAQTPFRRLRRDWLLLLEILALALLVLAAASPYWRTFRLSGARAAIVIDSSASMLAADRLDRARREATRLIDGMGPNDEATLLRAGAGPAVLVALTSDRDLLRRAVSILVAEPVSADLDAALELGRSVVGQEGELVLVTDVSADVPDFPRLQVRRVGATLPNTAILALGVRRSNPSGFDHQVFVRLRNASEQTTSGTLELRLDGSVRDVSAVELSPEDEQGITLELLGVEQGLLEVRWRAGRADGLTYDDAAFWQLRRPSERSYRIVGEADPFLIQALAALPAWRPARVGEGADLEVLVRQAPSEDGPPFLWIDPLELRRQVGAGAKVLHWQRAHPALRHIDLHPVRFGRVPLVERPVGSKVLARSTAGPLILEGVRGERRFLAWAFDPLESDLPLRVSFPLLVHNALEHLAPASGSLPGGIPTGETPIVPWATDGPVELIAPSGARRTLSPAAGRLHLPPIDQTGLWSLVEGERELRFAASLLSESESDLGDRGAAAADEVAVPRAKERISGARDLWRPLVFVGLVVVLLEGWAFHRRWLA